MYPNLQQQGQYPGNVVVQQPMVAQFVQAAPREWYFNAN